MSGKAATRYRIELGKSDGHGLTGQPGTAETAGRTIVIGHRNPDTDSVAAAFAYAAFKRAIGESHCTPACAGLPQKRTAYVFQRFGQPLPEVVADVWPKVADIVRPCNDVPHSGQTLLQASEILRQQRVERLPVTDGGGRYLGMVSLFDLADRLFHGSRGTSSDEIDRTVMTTIELAAQALEASVLTMQGEDELALLHIYVGAMNLYHMKERLLDQNPLNVALVVGDRGEIHHLAVETGVRLLVITGGCEIDPEFIRQATNKGVSILRTPHDSASTVRRLKFSSPVNLALGPEVRVFSPNERLRDIRREALSANYDGFPVVDAEGKLAGIFFKQDMQREGALSLVLVDHNELDQAVEGAEDVPVREIIDHHRLGIAATDKPIRVLNDIVGSTCTLVSEQFRLNGLTPDAPVAGVLLSGIITDTLMLRSPTSTPRDKRMIEWLQEIAGCDPVALEKEILASGSPLASLTSEQLVNADLKRYHEGAISFAVGQIEEAGFENLAARQVEIAQELQERLSAEKFNFIALLITNVVRSTSVMIAAGDEALLKRLPFERLDDGLYDLPGLVSRKKQLLPVLLNLFATMQP